MSLRINTNIMAMNTHRTMTMTDLALSKSLEKLSSGLRINRASDDAAGLSISENLRGQVRGLAQAERNAQDGISLINTAEGALNEVHSILQRMRELAVQASNGSLTSTDRDFLQTEFSSLQHEITRIQGSAKFNGRSLVGSVASTITLQVGLDAVSSDQIQVTLGGVSLTSIANSAAISGTGASSALASLAIIDASISSVSTARSSFGAAMNRLEVAQSNIETMRLNLSAANSRITDVDVASETSTMSRNQVLAQAGVSVLAQANQLPTMALSLLRQ
jgi:flagellin